ncbi:MAG: DUF3685 domain-containing protein [Pseudanabaena sp. ELA607]
MELVLITDDLVWQMGLQSFLSQESLNVVATTSIADLDLVLRQYMAGNSGKSSLSAEDTALIGRRFDRDFKADQISDRKLRRNRAGQPLFEPLLLEQLILLLDLDWGMGRGGEVLTYVRHHYPWLKVLVVGARAGKTNVNQLQGMGVMGCCLKANISDELWSALGCLRAGENYFSIYWQNDLGSAINTATSDAKLSGWHLWRERWAVQSQQRLAQNLAAVEANLQQLPPGIMRMVLTGQRRELAAVQWLAQRFLSPLPRDRQPPQFPKAKPEPSRDYGSSQDWSEPVSMDDGINPHQGVITENLLLEQVLQKLNSPLRNLNILPLEIDILQESKKRELLYLITKASADQLKELRHHTNNIDQLKNQISIFLTTIWREAITNFLGKYTVVSQFDDQDQASNPYLASGTTILSVVLADQALIQAEFLTKIPDVYELLAHLFFEHDLVIDNASYPVGATEALRRCQILLENLIITIANGVMQPILNHLGNLEEIKGKLYDRRLMPTRQVEHFRNELTWKYRRTKYFDEPQAIFESRYTVYTLTEFGIRTIEIYAPRKAELQELKGARFMVTLALELQDAITPRLKAIFSFVGSGLVYVLTNIVGRGLGLIGRGILQGIGSALQDKRFR